MTRKNKHQAGDRASANEIIIHAALSAIGIVAVLCIIAALCVWYMRESSMDALAVGVGGGIYCIMEAAGVGVFILGTRKFERFQVAVLLASYAVKIALLVVLLLIMQAYIPVRVAALSAGVSIIVGIAVVGIFVMSHDGPAIEINHDGALL